ncbi:hypothetical protein GGH99_005131 [Coemansia sp. RSA 1285]|nr:hypothetical protein GGH99_005131 [Coemansia sp. RSA 1285]
MPLFPIIKYVDCGSFYPFADNILWHGAESTLKSLVLAADNVLISWLFPENTSSNASPRPFSKYSRLQNLELRMITRAGVLDTQTQTIHNHIVAAVVDMVQVRRVSICYPNSYTVELKKGGSSTGGFE